MAAVLTGTPVAVVWAAGIDPAGQSVTIPSDATAVYMFWGYYNATTGNGLSSVTLAGASPGQTFEIPTQTGDQGAVGVAAWYNPPTGSQTIDPAWTVAPTEGAVCIVAFVKGGDTSAWRNANADSQTSTTACTTTITTVSGDLVIKFDQRYDVGANPPSLSAGWTNGATTDNNSEHARLSYISASGATQVCDSENEDYSTVCAISIPAASAPAALVTGKMPGRIIRPGFRGPPSFARFVRSPRDTSVLAAAGAQTLVQSSTFTNSNAFYAGKVNFRLNQSSTFTNSNAFYAGKVNFRLNQSSTFTNSNAFYAGKVNFRLNQSSTFTNSNTFYAGTVVNSGTTLLTGRMPGRLIYPGSRSPYAFNQFLRSPRAVSAPAAAPSTQTLVQSSTFTNSNTFYAGKVNFRLNQSSTFTNSNAFYAGKVNFRLNQSSTFTNSNIFYSGSVNTGSGLVQSSTFTNISTFYAGQVNLRLNQSSTFTNISTFYAGKVNFRLNQSSTFTNISTFYAGVARGNYTVVQSSTFTNSNTFYAGRVNLRLTQSNRYEGASVYYGGVLTGASPPIFDGGLVPIARRRIRL